MFPLNLSPPPLSFEWSSVGQHSDHFRLPLPSCNSHTSCPGVRQLWLKSGPHLSLFLRHQEKRGCRERPESPRPSLPYSSWAHHTEGSSKTSFVLVFHSLSLAAPLASPWGHESAFVSSLYLSTTANTLQSMNVSLVAGPIAAHF